MERKRPVFPAFTSALSRTEAALVLAYFPVHIVLLPRLLRLLYERGAVDVLWANVLLYGVGFGYMLAAAFRFLRRDFDPLVERPLLVAGQVCSGYIAMLACNMLAGLLIARLTDGAENMNNDALAELAEYAYGPMKAALVYLGPLTEEMLFRAGLFGTLRHKNRAAAYAVSMLAFSVYHVWGYALEALQSAQGRGVAEGRLEDDQALERRDDPRLARDAELVRKVAAVDGDRGDRVLHDASFTRLSLRR